MIDGIDSIIFSSISFGLYHTVALTGKLKKENNKQKTNWEDCRTKEKKEGKKKEKQRTKTSKKEQEKKTKIKNQSFE